MWLRRFSKLTCFSTLFLIFVGGMVTSTSSGLAVPDWPLSYGTLFPPMIGGVFYEHGHRMVASLVGFFMLCLAIGLGLKEERRWIKLLGYWALAAVIVQGLLGGITVLYFLPTAVSVAHGILAQTFFILTIVIAYSLSKERVVRENDEETQNQTFLKFSLFFIILVYVQLIVGAIMRHTHSGLAIPDFPKMGGYWFPPFNAEMLAHINHVRFDLHLDPVSLGQIAIHFTHRIGAFFIVIAVCILNIIGLKYYRNDKEISNTCGLIGGVVFFQIIFGTLTVLTVKSPIITSIHVVSGAAILGLAVLLFLRAAPISFNSLSKLLRSS